MIADEFKFKCCIGKSGIKKHKVEGDKSTPAGFFKLKTLYFRKDRIKKPETALNTKIIKKNMGWSNDPKSKFYNKEILIQKKNMYEILFRKDFKYDYFIVLDYNINPIIPNKGSAIFLHLTKNYKPTEGCIAIKKKDFEILLKIINKKTKIRIF